MSGALSGHSRRRSNPTRNAETPGLKPLLSPHESPPGSPSEVERLKGSHIVPEAKCRGGERRGNDI